MDPLKTPSTPETKLHFLDYWRIIRIRKTVILAVFLLVVITATIVTFILPEAFSSKARIKVERDVTDVPGVTGQPSGVGVYDPYFIQTEFEVIQSEKILDQVTDRLDLNTAWQTKYNSQTKLKYPESREMLRHMIELRPARNTSLIDITVYSDDKDEAARIANTVADVYQNYRKRQREDLIEGGMKAFKDELEEQGRLVKTQEEKVNDLRVKYNVVDTDPQSTAPGSSLGPVNVLHYNSLKIEAETQYIKQETLLSKLQELTPEELKQTIPTASPDAILGQLLQDQIATETLLVKLKNDLGDQHPDVQRT
jgi:succinoglycan biosynthesis transport protein ExoP